MLVTFLLKRYPQQAVRIVRLRRAHASRSRGAITILEARGIAEESPFADNGGAYAVKKPVS
jgi:hypothetical protein